MLHEKALEVITSLVSGKHDESGNEIDFNEVMEKPDTIRGLSYAKEFLVKMQGITPKRGAKWTYREEELLREMFRDKYSFKDIAKKLERTEGAVISRLEKLRLIEPRYNY
jgi:DNA-binding NarL/FixJ family response regulator